jgi:hypothetical protein
MNAVRIAEATMGGRRELTGLHEDLHDDSGDSERVEEIRYQ